jgi:hypothetical protein
MDTGCLVHKSSLSLSISLARIVLVKARLVQRMPITFRSGASGTVVGATHDKEDTYWKPETGWCNDLKGYSPSYLGLRRRLNGFVLRRGALRLWA